MKQHSPWPLRIKKCEALISHGFRSFEVAIDHHTKIKLPIGMHRQFWSGEHEDRDLIAFLGEQACGGTFMDIGANIGLYTMAVAIRGGAGSKAIAFEPCPSTFALLDQNLRFNKLTNAHCEPIAMSSSDGDLLISNYKNGANNFWVNADSGSHPVIRVSTVTLDWYCQAKNVTPKAIKIDVEGHELAVLRGARQTLQDLHPAMVLECHCASWPELGVSAQEVAEFLNDVGYSTLTNRRGEPVDLIKCRRTVHLCLQGKR